MPATRTSISTVLSIALIGASAIGVAGQDEESAAAPSTPTMVSGVIRSEGRMVQEPTEAVVDGILEVRGFGLEGDIWEMDDPRLSGTASVSANVNVHKETDFTDIGLQYVTIRVENEDGSWAGEGTNLFHGGANISPEESTNIATVVLVGSGAYDGLSAYLVGDLSADPPTIEGAIFAGDVPPYPEELPAS